MSLDRISTCAEQEVPDWPQEVAGEKSMRSE